MKYLLLEHIEQGQGSKEERHSFNTLDEVYHHIKNSGNLLQFFTLFAVNEIELDKNILDTIPYKPKETTWHPTPSYDLIQIILKEMKVHPQTK